MQEEEITFVCMSDTHSFQIDLPQGDVLIHAGDFSNVGEKQDILCFIQWLNRQPFKHKVIIAGNHEIGLDVQNYQKVRKFFALHNEEFDPQELINELKANCHYLENSSVVVEGYKIWGSPYSLKIGPWGFQLAEKDSEEFWKQIEEDSDIIVTHGPPWNHGDKEYYPEEFQRGDKALLERVLKIKPIYHIFGHQHDGYGITEEGGVTFINPSILNDFYKIAHEPIVFKLKRKQ